MKLSSLVDAELVMPSLKAATAREALQEMMEVVARHIEGLDKETLLEALYLRESIKPTAIEEEVAIPHARVEELQEFIFAIGVSHKGIDFHASDGKPSRLVFLILAPNSKNALMLHTMAGIAKLCIDEARRKALLNAGTAEDIVAIIEKSGVVIKKELTCADIMDAGVIGIDPEMTLKEVAAVFAQTDTDGLPVLARDGQLLGEITGKELLSVGLPKYINMFGDLAFLISLEPFEEFFKREETMKVREVYQKNVVTVNEAASIIEAAFLMVTKNKRHIYVVREGKLVGTVHRKAFISKVLHV
jgi:PTS system nitrogen regulatory IIA component